MNGTIKQIQAQPEEQRMDSDNLLRYRDERKSIRHTSFMVKNSFLHFPLDKTVIL